MPIFSFRGYRADGSEASGTVEADGRRDAGLKLRELGLYPKEISLETGRGGKRASAALLPVISRQLSTLISSGVPLMEALRTVAEESPPAWKSVLSALRERVSHGAALSRAMEDFHRLFPPFLRSMISAGEAGGTLDKSLSSISDYLEKEASVRQKARSAMIYPLIMAAVGFIVLSFIFVFVIPKMVRIFEYTESSLPIATVILIAASNVFVKYWWALGALLLGSAYALRAFFRKRKDLADALFLRLPGGMLRSLYFSRFTLTLGFLLEGGLPMLRALELSGKSTGNSAVEQKIRDAAGKVAEGGSLSASLEGFPPVLIQLISTGEKGGRLPELLLRAASSYEEDFKRRLDRTVSFVEPLMVIVMGAVVGFIVFAVLLPIFELNQLVK